MLARKGILRGHQYHSRAQHGRRQPSCAARLSADIIPHRNKILVKFPFLTRILCPLRYNESAKGRGDRIDSIEKNAFSGCTAYLRNCDAVLRSLARRGGYRAKQGGPAVFGVCGNWITKMRRRKKRQRIAVSLTLSGTVPSRCSTADQPSSAQFL